MHQVHHDNVFRQLLFMQTTKPEKARKKKLKLEIEYKDNQIKDKKNIFKTINELINKKKLS